MEQLMKQMETIKSDVGMSWKMVRLEDLTEDGFMIDGDWIESKDQDPSGDIRILQLADIGDGYFINKSNRFINRETSAKLRCTFLKKNDILIARMPDPLGRACLFPFEAENSYVTVVDVCIMRIKEDVDYKYVTYAINSPDFRNKIESQITGTTRLRISGKNLKNLQIPLPPLATQKRIAEILDAADALRRKDQELLKKYDELAQAIFIDMFGDPVKNEVKVSEIIAKGKNMIRSGPFGSDLLHSEFVEEGIFVLGIDNVVNNKFEINRGRFITEEKFKSLARYQVFPDDVLISVMATIGRTAVVPENIGIAINSKHLAAITPNKKLINSIYFSYLLSNDESIKKQIKRMSKGAIMDGLNLGIIKDLKFDLPPISKQIKFSQILQSIDNQKELLNRSASNSLFQTLIQKAFKGELVAE